MGFSTAYPCRDVILNAVKDHCISEVETLYTIPKSAIGSPPANVFLNEVKDPVFADIATLPTLAIAAGDESRNPEQGAFGVGRRQVGDRQARSFGVRAGGVHRILE